MRSTIELEAHQSALLDSNQHLISPRDNPITSDPSENQYLLVLLVATQFDYTLEKSAMMLGAAVSKPTTSSIPASFGSAIVNSDDTMPTTTSFAPMPIR